MEENNMSIVNFTSGINKIEQQRPLSEWAAEYIHSYSLSRENFSGKEAIRNLSRREKDAIRYQLRKSTAPIKRTRKDAQNSHAKSKTECQKLRKLELHKVARVILSVWISAFLLFDIVAIYVTKGATPIMAWQAALLVEICIIVAAMTTRHSIRRIAYALFSYNVLIFALMEVDQAITKTIAVRSDKTQVAQKQERIALLKKQLKAQLNASSDSMRQLSSAHARGFVTSGSIAFERVSRTLEGSTLKVSNEISRLEKDIEIYDSNSHTTVWIWSTSLLYFLLRCVLQFFSIRLLENQKD